MDCTLSLRFVSPFCGWKTIWLQSLDQDSPFWWYRYLFYWWSFILCEAILFFNHCSIFSDDGNISSVLVREDREELLICRTNGALERFNRDWIMPSPMHILPCVTTIRRISADKYTQYDRVASSLLHLCLYCSDCLICCCGRLMLLLIVASSEFYVNILDSILSYNRYHFAYYTYELYYSFY